MSTDLKTLFPAANAVLLVGDQTIAGVKEFTSSPIVPTPTTVTQAAPKGYVDSKALSADTTVNFTYDMTAAQIQALINAQPKNLNGYTLTFQFGDGTYNTSMTSSITFKDFYGGTLHIYGNITETDNSTLHTTQQVFLDFSAGITIGINVYNCYCVIDIRNLKVKISDTAGISAIKLLYSGYSMVRYCYCLGAAKTTDNHGVMLGGTNGQVANTYVSNVNKGIRAAYGMVMYSDVNDDTGTAPNYGLSAESSAAIGKYSTQPAGTTANENAAGGGVIR